MSTPKDEKFRNPILRTAPTGITTYTIRSRTLY
ncbi:hypothetical protein CLAFUW4_13866 [Fulvia fulva]|nr:uncharacterized protein CLAFUR5_20362 [Fulvia fulva]KAK4610657.1 hypothetical protein CLAFUR4_13869 [Fulvia fulva]KAK4611331.1 hypothetical protein CLAFUR0_13873 [Fulvia fulva]WMI39071.1 hypothetical protein CLAFUR5_20362 [Fulvia fulva]WPV22030.1 hypothetical protein CLAFUW4_13866 [Fulvia fulva]WPV37020.1 hypothetical protein CLAFUW7_13874 [Fulvia fulva]